MIQKKNEILSLIPQDFRKFYAETNELIHLNFPINQVPVKIESVNFNKTDKLFGRLIGIKGQYLIFEDGKVFNVRGSEGYIISLSVND